MSTSSVHRTMRVLAGAVLWVVMSACGLGAPTPIVFDEPLPDDPGPDVGGRALQEEIFADGVVTAAEYERENDHPINDPPTLEDAMASVAYGCEPWLTDDAKEPAR